MPTAVVPGGAPGRTVYVDVAEPVGAIGERHLDADGWAGCVISTVTCDRVALDDPEPGDRDVGRDLDRCRAAKADQQHGGDPGRRRDRLGFAREEPDREQTHRERDVRGGPRVAPGGDRGHGGDQFQVGAGIESTTERTTASGGVPRAHASSVSTTRCASVGRATARTSSGVTKSRPCSSACDA